MVLSRSEDELKGEEEMNSKGRESKRDERQDATQPPHHILRPMIPSPLLLRQPARPISLSPSTSLPPYRAPPTLGLPASHPLRAGNVNIRAALEKGREGETRKEKHGSGVVGEWANFT